MKTSREAGNCWTSLLEGEYCADPLVQEQMQKKLTLERFQREVSAGYILYIGFTEHHVIIFQYTLANKIINLNEILLVNYYYIMHM